VKLPHDKKDTKLPARIRKNPKFFPFFHDAVGALDGTHIACTVPTSKADPFRNRKGFLSQNVMAACNFDMYFTYVLAGWEGSASDNTVFDDALSRGFYVPPGQYYLGDAGYGLRRTLLVPYRGVRYHLREQARANLRPANPQELFNLRHAQMRNVIERIFGTLKKRFQILSTQMEYRIEDQVKLVYALTALHNFIRQRMHGKEDVFYEQADRERERILREEMESESGQDDREEARLGRAELDVNKRWRDGIADAMWEQYQSVIGRRGGGN
jgi:hypothetical protein